MNAKTIFGATLAIAMVAAFALPAGAAELKKLSLNGEIIAVKDIDVQGTDLKHKVVKIKTDQGERVVVDLGPHDQINGKIKEGEKIKISGNWGRVQDQMVLFASESDVGGQKSTIKREARGKIQGEVIAIHRVGLKDSDSKHRLAIINTDKGRLAVDLGEDQKFQGKVNEGDTVTVRGSLVKAQDRPVLMASSIENQGETVVIERN